MKLTAVILLMALPFTAATTPAVTLDDQAPSVEIQGEPGFVNSKLQSFNATRDVVTISIADNGRGDDDPNLGIIRDPGGLGPAAPMRDPVNPSFATAGSDGGSGGGSTGPYLLILLLLIVISVARRPLPCDRSQRE